MVIVLYIVLAMGFIAHYGHSFTLNRPNAFNAASNGIASPTIFLKRQRRFQLLAKWPGRLNSNNELSLSWFVEDGPTSQTSRANLVGIVRQVFIWWTSKSTGGSFTPGIRLAFTEATSSQEADITIKFARGDHGDGSVFDGPPVSGYIRNNLAHAFPPTYARYPNQPNLKGDIHFDADDQWSFHNRPFPRDHAFHRFTYALAHEIGHSLGLDHSYDENALMHAQYKSTPIDEIAELSADDICAVFMLYTTTSTTVDHIKWHLCFVVYFFNEVVQPLIDMTRKRFVEDRLGYVDSTVYVEGSCQAIESDGYIMPECTDANRLRQRYELWFQYTLAFEQALASTMASILCGLYIPLYNGCKRLNSEHILVIPDAYANQLIDETIIPRQGDVATTVVPNVQPQPGSNRAQLVRRHLNDDVVVDFQKPISQRRSVSRPTAARIAGRHRTYQLFATLVEGFTNFRP